MDRDVLAENILFLMGKERKNSFEFGKAIERHKIYYDTVEELEEKVVALTAAGFINGE